MKHTDITAGKDINDTDRLYKTPEGLHVKVRVIPKARNVYVITCSLCDENGNAVSIADGEWWIDEPHTVTMNMAGDPAASFLRIIEARIDRVVEAKQAEDSTAQFFNNWKADR